MKTKWAVLLLILAGFIAYGNTLKNGLFWDDDEFIKRNEFIRSFSQWPNWFSKPLTMGAGVNSNYYRPLLMANFTIDYHLWGLWPAGYHFENILWHVVAGILLFVFLSMLISVVSSAVERPSVSDINNPIASLDSSTPSRLRRDSARNDGTIEKIIAFSTALLWLVHPAHVEAVAYANSRGDSMATVFILLSLILWMKNKIKTSAVAFILALLSKEFAIVTPGLILLIESLRGAPATWQSRLIPKIKPFLIVLTIASIYILLRLTVLNFQNTLNFYGVDTAKADQAQPLTRYATSLPVRLMTFLKVLPIYTGILIWPNDLHMERTIEIVSTLTDQAAFISFLVVVSLLIIFYFLLIRKKSIPMFAFGWFFISILPVSGLIPISQILAEHFLYLPSIGFFLMVSWVSVNLSYLSSRAKSRDPATKGSDIDIADARFLDSRTLARNDEKYNLARYLSLIFVLLLAIPLVIKTISQNRIWRDPITFYEYTLARTQPTARVYNNLAMAYADIKNHGKAIENYQKSIAMGDVYPNPHYNLGNTFMETGDMEKAEEEYGKALKIDPNFHYATLRLGQIYINQGKIDDAKKLVCHVFPFQPLCIGL